MWLYQHIQTHSKVGLAHVNSTHSCYTSGMKWGNSSEQSSVVSGPLTFPVWPCTHATASLLKIIEQKEQTNILASLWGRCPLSWYFLCSGRLCQLYVQFIWAVCLRAGGAEGEQPSWDLYSYQTQWRKEKLCWGVVLWTVISVQSWEQKFIITLKVTDTFFHEVV